jgi:catechol 2,3-dioxygenase-like lactoylglutathione lyase family enzyme
VWAVRVLVIPLVAVAANALFWLVLPVYGVEAPPWLVVCFNVAFLTPLFWLLPSMERPMHAYPSVDECRDRLHRAGWSIGEAAGSTRRRNLTVCRTSRWPAGISTFRCTASRAAIRFHLSLNVSNLERSIAFYRILFGCEPAKRRPDYAKFELNDPPLELSLEPTPRGEGGALNHLGFRMPDSAALVLVQRRLEQAGIHTKHKEGVECCYARQTKFWVTDPDQTLWEIYTLDEDIDHRGAGQTREQMLPQENR